MIKKLAILKMKCIGKGLDPCTSHLVDLVFRCCVGAGMLVHGYGKLSGGSADQFPDPIGLGSELSYCLAVFSEFFCSLLLILGLFTRPAAIMVFFTMAVAVLVVHAEDPFSAKELALLYAVCFCWFSLKGGGLYSVDHFLYKKYFKKHLDQ